MQSAFKKLRTQILGWLFNKLLPMYSIYFKKKIKPWKLSNQNLLNYTKGTLGYQLGFFLQQNKLVAMPKLENHDCLHIITGFSTAVKDEIALQYLCFGNGERNLTTILVISFGTLLLPEHFKYYTESFKKGKKYKPLYQLNFKNYLQINLQTLQNQLLWTN
ncbi:MAG TPA: hypothetical protein ENK67_03520 [Flavobacteriia bacterium]|jgi:ubiquinone biosynthesis protein Coq4|nr:hypothetical protein [Flavobacteriia bacterium]